MQDPRLRGDDGLNIVVAKVMQGKAFRGIAAKAAEKCRLNLRDISLALSPSGRRLLVVN